MQGLAGDEIQRKGYTLGAHRARSPTETVRELVAVWDIDAHRSREPLMNNCVFSLRELCAEVLAHYPGERARGAA